jgi:hypothetical protein
MFKVPFSIAAINMHAVKKNHLLYRSYKKRRQLSCAILDMQISKCNVISGYEPNSTTLRISELYFCCRQFISLLGLFLFKLAIIDTSKRLVNDFTMHVLN